MKNHQVAQDCFLLKEEFLGISLSFGSLRIIYFYIVLCFMLVKEQAAAWYLLDRKI